MTKTVKMPAKVQKFIKDDIGLFINNVYVNSENKNTFDVYNPADDTLITRVSEANSKDIDYAVECAEKLLKVNGVN